MIKEQGPKNYEAMRARVEARAEMEATTPAGVDRFAPPRFAPIVADVENDGDRGPSIGTLRCVRLQKLDAATVNLDARSLDVLLWIASQLPATKLRTGCEEATARGWVRPDARHVEVPVGPEDRARAELLGVVRTIEGLLFRDAEGKPAVTPRRSREEVLADAAARGGAK